jgi:hypothetical protein
MLEVPCKMGTCNAVHADASEVVGTEVQKLLKMENTKGRIFRKPMTIVSTVRGVNAVTLKNGGYITMEMLIVIRRLREVGTTISNLG